MGCCGIGRSVPCGITRIHVFLSSSFLVYLKKNERESKKKVIRVTSSREIEWSYGDDDSSSVDYDFELQW